MNYSELAIQIMDHDIDFWCSRYWIPGYEKEDLMQECRMALYKASKKFRTDKGVYLRTWANTVIKNHLRNLLRDANTEKRKGNDKTTQFNDQFCNKTETIEDYIDILLENHIDFVGFL